MKEKTKRYTPTTTISGNVNLKPIKLVKDVPIQLTNTEYLVFKRYIKD